MAVLGWLLEVYDSGRFFAVTDNIDELAGFVDQAKVGHLRGIGDLAAVRKEHDPLESKIGQRLFHSTGGGLRTLQALVEEALDVVGDLGAVILH